MVRHVYSYEQGIPMSKKLHLKVTDSAYKQALEYVMEKERKNNEFLNYISELHKDAKRQFNKIIEEKPIIQSDKSEENSKLMEKLEVMCNIIQNLEKEIKAIKEKLN